MKPYILQTINFSTERSSWVPPRHDTRRQFAIWVMQARLGMNHGWWVMGGRPDETVWFSTLRPYRCFPGGMKVLPGIEVFLTMNLFYAQKKGKHVQCTSTIKSYKIIWGKPSHTSLGCLGVHVLSNVALVFLVGMIYCLVFIHGTKSSFECGHFVKFGSRMCYCFVFLNVYHVPSESGFPLLGSCRLCVGDGCCLACFNHCNSSSERLLRPKNGVTVSKIH